MRCKCGDAEEGQHLTEQSVLPSAAQQKEGQLLDTSLLSINAYTPRVPDLDFH